MASTMTWTVEVIVRLGPIAAEAELGDQFLGELIALAATMGPAVAQDTEAGTISAILSVTGLDDPDDALSAGRNAVTTALHRLGLTGAEVGLSVVSFDATLTNAR